MGCTIAETAHISLGKCTLISALASAPSRPPNPTLAPQNEASFQKPSFKSPKTQKTGCAYSEHYTK